MTNFLICFVFLVGNLLMAIYLSRRGFKGLREKKMLVDRVGNFVAGKNAVSIAKIYLFFAALCLAFTIMLFICAIRLMAHLW